MLLGLDLAEQNPRILPLAKSLADSLTLDVLVCHVVMRSTSVAGNERDGFPANAEETAIARRLMSELVGEFGERGHVIPVKILHGDPGQRIVEYADFAGCDLIVLGAGRRASLGKVFRGSVNKYVVGNSRHSVLVVGD
ncbi:MAG: universal stress protein [Thermoplasmata archaeon]